MSAFVFDSYLYDSTTQNARFTYRYESFRFTETLHFSDVTEEYDNDALERALFLAFVLIGTSYYKAFPVRDVEFQMGAIDEWQASFLNTVYQEGMSQFAYENNLTRDKLAHFSATSSAAPRAVAYKGEGILALQSGGKDSLLTAALLEQKGVEFDSLYISSSETYPRVLDELQGALRTVRRLLDREMLLSAREVGGLNGHVPVTYIVLATATLQAILLGKNTVLASIGHEGEEPHAMIGDLPVNHQWSKTWPAEQRFAEYVERYVASTLRVGSPLRSHSELRISQLFAEQAWQRFSHTFSSCNLGNYMQGADNSQLKWCGGCPKCANAFLLFAPYVTRDELTSLLGGQDLFARADLQETFKGLLGVDGVMKPLECVGEVDELRHAYRLSGQKGYERLSFAVPAPDFDELKSYAAQQWASALVSP